MKSGLMPILAAVILTGILSAGCGQQPEERPLTRNGSLDITVETRHLDSLHDVLHTHHVVYVHGSQVRELDRYDTIPSLGSLRTEGEDDDGNTAQLTVPKDYEIYVTTK